MKHFIFLINILLTYSGVTQSSHQETKILNQNTYLSIYELVEKIDSLEKKLDKTNSHSINNFKKLDSKSNKIITKLDFIVTTTLVELNEDNNKIIDTTREINSYNTEFIRTLDNRKISQNIITKKTLQEKHYYFTLPKTFNS